MSDKFDDLIREGRDTDALRLMARGMYENGRVGHTRMSMMVRVADDLDQKTRELEFTSGKRQKKSIRDFFMEIASEVIKGEKYIHRIEIDDGGINSYMVNGERYLGFTPTMNYNAKSAYGIKGLVKVPDLKDGDPNDFLTRLFAQVKANLSAESATLKPQQEAYERAMADGQALLNSLDSPDKALSVLNSIRTLAHGLTSQKELEVAFKAKVKDLGWTYDAKAKAYVLKGEE